MHAADAADSQSAVRHFAPEDVTGEMVADLLEEIIHALFTGPGDPRMAERLEGLILDIYRSPMAMTYAIPLGLRLMMSMSCCPVERQGQHRLWRLMHKVTEAVAEREDVLEYLACCWYEHLADDPRYLDWLLRDGISPTVAWCIANHLGYADESQKTTIRRRLHEACPEAVCEGPAWHLPARPMPRPAGREPPAPRKSNKRDQGRGRMPRKTGRR